MVGATTGTIPPAEVTSLQKAQDAGRTLRGRLPRRVHAELTPPAERDPLAILAAQNETRLADLVPIRLGRMLESPFAYYRGSAAVMAHDLAAEARTGVDLVVCGDAHISNFGLFAAPDRRVLFDLNDFDETAFGPWEWDVKRLVGSTVVAARQLGLTEAQAEEAALATAQGYRLGLRQLLGGNALDRYYHRVETDWLEEQARGRDQKVVRRTIKAARRRTSDRVLAKVTTTGDCGSLRINDEFPIIRHDDALPVELVARIYDAYRTSVNTDIRLLLAQFRVVDAVLRIVGVGSVGTRCYIALLLGPSDEPLFIQIKEAPASVLATFGGQDPRGSRKALGVGDECEGWRVVAGQRVLQAASDPFLGWFSSDGRDYYCRQFRDMKGSFELEALSAAEFTSYVALCGRVLARGHAQSPAAGVVAGYLGASARFDEAMAAWAQACADRNERDHAALEQAVKDGRLSAEIGV